MSFFDIFMLLLWVFLGGYLLYQTYLWIERRLSAKYVTASQLRELGRKIQIIDVREKAEFDAKHILGARNIPYTQIKQRLSEFRKDQPIYLCDEFVLVAGKTAGKLKRAGFKDIYILKGGLDSWTGKFKSNKK